MAPELGDTKPKRRSLSIIRKPFLSDRRQPYRSRFGAGQRQQVIAADSRRGGSRLSALLDVVFEWQRRHVIKEYWASSQNLADRVGEFQRNGLAIAKPARVIVQLRKRQNVG